MSFVSQSLVLALGFLIPLVFTQSNEPPITVWEIGQFSFTEFNAPGGLARFCNFTNGAFATVTDSGDTAIFNAEITEVLWCDVYAIT